jgi:hypothetical protein
MLFWNEAINPGRQLTTDAAAWQARASVQPKSGGYEIPVPGLTEVL